MKENDELHKQLKSNFKRLLQRGDKKSLEFAKILVKQMRPSQVHDLLQAKLSSSMTNNNPHLKKTMEDNLKKLRWLDQLEFENFGKFVEDVPLAYWMAHLQIEQKVCHTSTSTEREESTSNIIMFIKELITNQAVLDNPNNVDTRSISSESTSNIVIFIKELSVHKTTDSRTKGTGVVESSKDVVVLEGYPNNMGKHTGRTALHWAVIFGDKEIVKELCGDPRCKRDVVDRFGKPPYSYVKKNQTEHFDGYLKWDKYDESMQKNRDVYIDGLNAILIGAALIATVTFSGVLQPPLQYPMSNRDPNPDIKYVAINRADVQTFWVLNSLSFFFSMASALAGITGVLPNGAVIDLALVHRMRRLLVRAAIFLVLSITFVLAAFTSAGFAVLPQVLKLRANMIVTTLIGGFWCVCMLWKFITAVDQTLHALAPESSWITIPKLIWRSSTWSPERMRSIWSSLWNSIWSSIRRHCTRKEEKEEEKQIPKKEGKKEDKKGGKKEGKKQLKSIRSNILTSDGYVPWEYVWDDGLWDEPFAKMDEPSDKKESRIDISSEG